jgi:hypothetical protein
MGSSTMLQADRATQYVSSSTPACFTSCSDTWLWACGDE